MQVSVSARLQGKVRPERGPAATTDFEKWPREGRIYMMLQCRATMPGQQKISERELAALGCFPDSTRCLPT
jgi:hypothetical protein